MSLIKVRSSESQPIKLATKDPSDGIREVRPVSRDCESSNTQRPFDWEIDDSGLVDQESTKELGKVTLTAIQIIDDKLKNVQNLRNRTDLPLETLNYIQEL